MSKREKREEKIRANPRNVSLADFEWLVNQYGKILEGGSHPQAIIGRDNLPYRRENPVKAVYTRKLLQFIDRLNLKEG